MGSPEMDNHEGNASNYLLYLIISLLKRKKEIHNILNNLTNPATITA